MEGLDNLLIGIAVISAFWFIISILKGMFDAAGSRHSGIYSFATAVISIILFVLTLVLDNRILSIFNDRKNIPTAMDVYQNKTILEYKVVGDLKVDSCVIWKPEIYKN